MNRHVRVRVVSSLDGADMRPSQEALPPSVFISSSGRSLKRSSIRRLATALLGLPLWLSLRTECCAAGFEQIKTERVLRLAGDFAGATQCKVEGEYSHGEQDGLGLLAATKDVRIAFDEPVTPPYTVRSVVRLAGKASPKAKLTLTCGTTGKPRYDLELEPRGNSIDVRGLADQRNLGDGGAYRYREGRPTEIQRYQLKFERKQLEQKAEGLRKVLQGRQDEWKEWDLGIRGDFAEEQELRGLEDLIIRNDGLPSAAERWTSLRIEVSREALRMWVDGRLVGEVPEPRLPSAGISLQLPAGSVLMSLDVTRPAQDVSPFLPVDLAGYSNHRLDCVDGLPRGLVTVQGVPFLLGASPDGCNCIDVGESAPMETGFAQGFMDSPLASASGLIRHPSRIVLQLPKAWYTHLYLLALSDKDADTEPVVSFRFFRDERTGTIIDHQCEVPSRDEKAKGKAIGSLKLRMADGKDAWVHVVDVPLDPCRFQNYLEKHYFEDFRVEISKRLCFTRGYPDPWNYVSVPAGLRSSVKILGLTFRTSPLQMVVKAGEVGSIFADPEKPVLDLQFRSTAENALRASLNVSIEDTLGRRKVIQDRVDVPGSCVVRKNVALGLECYGFYRIRAEAAAGTVRLVKETTFGYLPPDTRRATWRDSSFGLWNWGAGVGGYSYPVNSEETVRLIWKLGGRWALQPADPDIARKYGITNAWSFLPGKVDPQKVPGEKWEEELKRSMLDGLRKNAEKFPDQDLFLVFGEVNLGQQQTYALPGRYYGEPDYQLTEKEKEKFDRFNEQLRLHSKVLNDIRKEYAEFRHVKIAFGNTSPNFHVEFLRRGLPKDAFDVFGIDIPYFERMPERPPRAVEASQLLYLRDACRELGFGEVPIVGTEDMYYPGCPGSLTQREQADYLVRCHLLKFAFGVSREASVAMVFTTAGPYGEGHYGAAGLFEVCPEGGGDGNPREGAVAYATMTRELDAAKFIKYLPTGSLSTFCLAFSRPYQKDDVLALWTIHGTRDVSLQLERDAKAEVTDQWGKSFSTKSRDGVLTVRVCSSPVYVGGMSVRQVRDVTVGPAAFTSRPSDPHTVLDDFDTAWMAQEDRDVSYETNCFDLPKFRGEMTSSISSNPDGGKAFRIALQKPAVERKLSPWYTIFTPPKRIALPGKPTKLGLYVHGNSGWGRIIPQLTDAKGEVWTFIGPKDAWNADDIRSQSMVNFDGWKYMEMELPNNLPNRWPGPALAFWKNVKGDRVADHPLTLTALYIEQYTHVCYVNEVVPVPEPAIEIDKIVCTYDDPYAQWHLMKGW